jgi:vesicle-fusing ATPase
MTTAPLRPVLGVLSGPSRAEQVKPGLVAEIDRIRTLLRRLVEGEQPADLPPGEVATLDHIANRLGLTPFERDVLLLAVAAELDGEVAALVGTVQGGDSRPTFALAMTLLADPHWDAVSPGRPLRRWRLLEPVQGGPLPSRPLVVDEYAVHTVTGLAADGLLGRWEAARSGGPPAGWLTASQQAVADEVVAAVAALDGPVVGRLDGSDPDACAAVAERVAEGLGLVALVVRDAALSDADVVTTAAVLDREAVLHDRLLVTADARLLPLLESRIVLVTRGPGEPDARQEPVSGRTVVARSVHLPTAAEQATLWRRALGRVRAPVSAAASDIAHHYRLPARSVAAIAGEWRALPDRDVDALRRLTRERARVRLGPLAERIQPRAPWDDPVVAPGQQMLLHDPARPVRHRSPVYEDWGLDRKGVP